MASEPSCDAEDLSACKDIPLYLAVHGRKSLATVSLKGLEVVVTSVWERLRRDRYCPDDLGLYVREVRMLGGRPGDGLLG